MTDNEIQDRAATLAVSAANGNLTDVVDELAAVGTEQPLVGMALAVRTIARLRWAQYHRTASTLERLIVERATP